MLKRERERENAVEYRFQKSNGGWKIIRTQLRKVGLFHRAWNVSVAVFRSTCEQIFFFYFTEYKNLTTQISKQILVKKKKKKDDL